MAVVGFLLSSSFSLLSARSWSWVFRALSSGELPSSVSQQAAPRSFRRSRLLSSLVLDKNVSLSFEQLTVGFVVEFSQ